MSQLRKYAELPLRHKILLVYAWILLGCYRAAILVVPVKRLTGPLQHSPGPVCSSATAAQTEEAVTVGRLVSAAARVTPWQSLCLVQVLVVRRILARSHIPGQVFLGVRRGEEAGKPRAGLSGHAWLQCGQHIVNGDQGHERFTVLSGFSW